MEFDAVTKEGVLRAMADLDAGLVPAGFRESTTYDVVHDGKAYPPKQLIALALTHST